MKSALASLLISLLTHGLLVAGMAWILAHDSAHVAGAPGLAGAPGSQRFDVTMDPIVVPPPEAEPIRPAPPVREGVPVAALVEERAERERPREAMPPAPPAEVGTGGQAGTGDEAAARVGDSNRTNRLGLYLQKMHKKIHGNLSSPGFTPFTLKTKLRLELRKDGNVTKITVHESSGEAALDRLAIRAVQKSSPFDPWEQDEIIELPVIFQRTQ